MDEHISGTKRDYYDSLQYSSFGWRENRWSYFPFIRYFLRTLLECYIDLDTRFALVDGKGIGRKQTVKSILSKSVAPMSVGQIRKVLPDISIYTIRKALQSLLEDGSIKKIGNTKGARYIYRRRGLPTLRLLTDTFRQLCSQ